jgi:hypothetical protein
LDLEELRYGSKGGRKVKLRLFFIIIIFLVVCIKNSFAGWINSATVVEGRWGSEPGQFGYSSADIAEFDSFPKEFCMDASGNVVIEDNINKRIQIFTSLGLLKKVVTPPIEIDVSLGWPYGVYCHTSGNFIAKFEGSQTFFYDVEGNFLVKKDIFGEAFAVIDGFYFETEINEYSLYSMIGDFIKVIKEKPLELGIVKEKKLSPKKYKVTVKYPDKEWGILRDGTSPFYSYVRDMNGNLHGVGNTQIVRFNECGKEITKLTLPKEQYQSVTLPPEWPLEAEPPRQEVLEEYGPPVLAPNGDVYAWKRTPDKYSILKWTWQDDPNPPANIPDAPTELAVSSSTTGLDLTWKESPQDPGCVTGYEIARSETSGGTFTKLADVEKGVSKYEDTTATVGITYYYNVRAAGGDGFSEYSGEASGKK